VQLLAEQIRVDSKSVLAEQYAVYSLQSAAAEQFAMVENTQSAAQELLKLKIQ
jgi:hypothetical protein